MKKNLVEHIIDEEYVEASDVFAGTLSSILEQKLYEMKRSIDLTEVVKKTRKKDVDGNPVYTGQNTKADWAKYRKQNPSMSFHGTPANPKAKAPAEKKEKTSTGSLTKHGIEARRKRGYLQAAPALNAVEFIKRINKYKETGKINENNLQELFPNQAPATGKNPKRNQTAGREPTSSIANQNIASIFKQELDVSNKQKEAKKYIEKRAKRGKGYEKSKGASSPMDMNALSSAAKPARKSSGSNAMDMSKMAKPKATIDMSKMAKKETIGDRIKRHLHNIKTGSDSSRSGKPIDRVKYIKSIPGVQKARNIVGSVMQSPWEVTHSESVMNEVITAKTPVSSVIRDFVHSKDKKFKGDSKKKRIKRALGAYYSMHEAKAWKDLSQEAKKHPFGKSKNNPLTKRRRKRRLVKKIFNEE